LVANRRVPTDGSETNGDRSPILLRTVADMAPCRGEHLNRGRLTTLEHPRRTQTRPGVLRPKPAGSPSTDPRRRHRADPQP